MTEHKYAKIGGVLYEGVQKDSEWYSKAVKLADGLLAANTLEDVKDVFDGLYGLILIVKYMNSAYVESFWCGYYEDLVVFPSEIHADSMFEKAAELNCYDAFVDLYRMIGGTVEQMIEVGFSAGRYLDDLLDNAVKSSTEDIRLCKFMVENDIVKFQELYDAVKKYDKPVLLEYVKANFKN